MERGTRQPSAWLSTHTRAALRQLPGFAARPIGGSLARNPNLRIDAMPDGTTPSDATRRHRVPDPAGRVSRAIQAGGRILSDLLVPPLCLSCRSPLSGHDSLCATCWSGIDFIRAPLCDRLGIPLPYDTGEPRTVSAGALADPPRYDRARAVARYAGTMRELIHALKYGDQHHMVRLFGRWLAVAAAELAADAHLIVPVPLARSRLWSRRFNQSALVAAALGRETGIAHDPLALIKKRATPSQVGLTLEARRRNVEGAFAVDPARRASIKGRNIILVDDVVTTGATVEACAIALRRAGAARIDVAALGRVTGDIPTDA